MTRARGWYYQPGAAEDAEGIIAQFVLSEGGPGLARRFISSLETSLDRLLERGDSYVRLLRLDGQGEVRRFSHADLNIFGDLEIGFVAFSNDGRRLLASSFSCWDMRTWDVAAGTLIAAHDTESGGSCPYPVFLVDDDRRMFAGLHGLIGKQGAPGIERELAQRGHWSRFVAAGNFAWTVGSKRWMFSVHDVRDGRKVFTIDVAELENDELK